MTEKGNEWELAKENILPLRQGRKISSLRNALAPKTESNRNRKQHEFENELRTYEGSDPLEVWYKYIQWIEQNYPKGGNSGNLPHLVTKCVKTFLPHKNYHNDSRYIEIWIKYASDYVNILEVYSYMHSHNIGCRVAIFYENWAWQLQQAGNTKRAFAILQEGLQRNAEPRSCLLAAEKKLQSQLVQQVKDDIKSEDVSPSVDRACGNVLKPVGRNAAPVVRVGSHVIDGGPQKYGVAAQQQTAVKTQFQIFNDENAHPSTLSTEATKPNHLQEDSCKENNRKPGKWGSQRMKDNLVCNAENNKPAFSIHIDEDAVSSQQKRNLPSRESISNVLSTKKPSYKAPQFLLEPCVPNSVVMYNRYKVYGGTEEFQFEEIRAARLFAKMKEAERLAEAEKKHHELEKEIRILQEKVSSLQMQAARSSNSTPTSEITENTSNSVVKEQPEHLSKVSEDKSGQKTEIRSQSSSYNHSPTRQVQELWNATLFHNSTGGSKTELVHSGEKTEFGKNHLQQPEVHASSKNAPAHKLVIYEDTNDIQNQENVPPTGYVQGHCKRSLAGILKQSTNVPMIPLTDQINDDDEEEEDEEDYFGIFPLPSSQEGTITAVVTEEQFNARLKHTSTVFQSTLIQPPPENDFTTNLAGQNIGSECKSEAVTILGAQCTTSSDELVWSSENASTYPARSRISCGPKNLSTIMEGSREDRYKSSSSASSSSGAHSTMGLTYSNLHSANNTKSINRLPLPITGMKVGDDFAKPKLPDPILNADNIDPFSAELQTYLLKNLKKPLGKRNGYYKKPMKMPRIREASSIEIGSKVFHVLKELTTLKHQCKLFLAEESSCADLTFEDLEDLHSKIVVKINKPPNEWEFYISSELQQRLGCTTPNCDMADSFMLVDNAQIYNDKSILTSSYEKHGTLVDLINAAAKSSTTLHENVILYFTYEMLKIVSQMHKCHIIHADVKPDNFLVLGVPCKTSLVNRESMEQVFCLRLIDFGQSIDMELLPEGTTFTQQVRTSGFQCTEMLDSKPWTYQTDWFGVLGCIHVMLFSKYMEVEKNNHGTWQITAKFRRYWRKSFWEELFHTLLNIPNCESLPDVRPFLNTIKETLQDHRQWADLQMSGTHIFSMLNAATRSF